MSRLSYFPLSIYRLPQPFPPFEYFTAVKYSIVQTKRKEQDCVVVQTKREQDSAFGRPIYHISTCHRKTHQNSFHLSSVSLLSFSSRTSVFQKLKVWLYRQKDRARFNIWSIIFPQEPSELPSFDYFTAVIFFSYFRLPKMSKEELKRPRRGAISSICPTL